MRPATIALGGGLGDFLNVCLWNKIKCAFALQSWYNKVIVDDKMAQLYVKLQDLQVASNQSGLGVFMELGHYILCVCT